MSNLQKLVIKRILTTAQTPDQIKTAAEEAVSWVRAAIDLSQHTGDDETVAGLILEKL